MPGIQKKRSKNIFIIIDFKYFYIPFHVIILLFVNVNFSLVSLFSNVLQPKLELLKIGQKM